MLKLIVYNGTLKFSHLTVGSVHQANPMCSGNNLPLRSSVLATIQEFQSIEAGVEGQF